MKSIEEEMSNSDEIKSYDLSHVNMNQDAKTLIQKKKATFLTLPKLDEKEEIVVCRPVGNERTDRNLPLDNISLVFSNRKFTSSEEAIGKPLLILIPLYLMTLVTNRI